MGHGGPSADLYFGFNLVNFQGFWRDPGLNRFWANLFKEMAPYNSMQNMSANMSKNNANQQEARNCPIVGFKQSEADCSMTDPRKK